MDKETLSNYGWIVICVLVMVVMIALATPFGSFISEAVQSTTKGLFDVNKSALDSTGLINIDNQEFDVPDMNHGAGETPVVPNEPEIREGYLSGTWVFDDELGTIGADEGMRENIKFKINLNGKEMTFCGIDVSIVLMGWSETGIEMAYLDDGTYGEHYVEYSGYWIDEQAKTITFTHEQQVSMDFWNWFTAHATKQ